MFTSSRKMRTGEKANSPLPRGLIIFYRRKPAKPEPDETSRFTEGDRSARELRETTAPPPEAAGLTG